MCEYLYSASLVEFILEKMSILEKKNRKTKQQQQKKKPLRIHGNTSRTLQPKGGLFLLMLMHFYAESKYGNENFDSYNF